MYIYIFQSFLLVMNLIKSKGLLDMHVVVDIIFLRIVIVNKGISKNKFFCLVHVLSDRHLLPFALRTLYYSKNNCKVDIQMFRKLSLNDFSI